jgi:hypothetical protein
MRDRRYERIQKRGIKKKGSNNESVREKRRRK